MSKAVIDTIALPKSILLVTGLFPEHNKPLRRKVAGFLSYFYNVAFVASMAAENFNHFDNYAVLSEQISITIPSTSYMFKLTSFIFAKKYFLILMDAMDSEEFNNYPKSQEIYITKQSRFTKVVAIIFQTACALTCIMYIIMPFVTKEDLPVMFNYNLGQFKPAMFVFQIVGKLLNYFYL